MVIVTTLVALATRAIPAFVYTRQLAVATQWVMGLDGVMNLLSH